MNAQKYWVIIGGFVLPEKSRAEVLRNLAALFNSTPSAMEKLLQGEPVAFKKKYDYDAAKKISDAVCDAGAACQVVPVSGDGDGDAADGYDDGDDGDRHRDDGDRHRDDGGDGDRHRRRVGDHRGDDGDGDRYDGDGDRYDGDDDRDDGDRHRDDGDNGDHHRHRAGDHRRDDGNDGDADRDDGDFVDDDGDAADHRHRAGDHRGISALLPFVAVNTAYYARRFARFGGVARPSFALTWHWPACFAFFFWAVYRKLWRWAALHLAGGVVLLLAVEPGLAHIVWALAWPLAANYLYFRHARRRVLAAVRENRAPSADPAAGVSRAALSVSVVLMLSLSFAFNNLIGERLLERYGERVGEVLPGSRLRGDGSAIDDIKALPPKTAATATALGLLAATLKLAVDNNNVSDSERALTVFEKILADKNISDTWGTRIALRRDAAGHAALVSAGPDRAFDTDDDILQYIRFDDWLVE